MDGWTDRQVEGWMSEAPSDVKCRLEEKAEVVRLREPEITSAPLKCKKYQVNSKRMDGWMDGRTEGWTDGWTDRQKDG